jgi:hypothetical protein
MLVLLQVSAVGFSAEHSGAVQFFLYIFGSHIPNDWHFFTCCLSEILSEHLKIFVQSNSQNKLSLSYSLLPIVIVAGVHSF